MRNIRSSRRIPPLRDGDIDHEIDLVDNATSVQGSPAVSPPPDAVADPSRDGVPLTTSESQAALTDAAAPMSNGHDGHSSSFERRRSQGNAETLQPEDPHVTAADGSASANGDPGTSGNGVRKSPSQGRKKHPRVPQVPETAIDILYENERGGFLCGIPLFSGAALGNLDPPPWTNAAHKPSPTSTKTAQVPDPSWEWVWPEWRVNRDDTIDADKDGWEYSFMFSKRFAWHGPKWYSSFVRRRAWIRRRIKKGFGYQANDPHLLNPAYFSVSSTKPQSLLSAASSAADGTSVGRASRASLVHEEDVATPKVDIESIDVLMQFLRRSRIDREKLEAVQDYMEHSKDDLLQLQDHMHEIMSAFVFQASRRLLLTRLIQAHDNVAKQPEASRKSSKLRRKIENLAAAIKHADEEVRRLEYWSDVKGMAENGDSRGAVADDKGWEAGWEGIDKSGAVGANNEELP